MKVCFETFGCRLNKAEALQMEAEYLAQGWEVTSEHSKADRIVVRGCSVTARAQEDCEKLIAHLKRKYRKTDILVCGCLPSSTPNPQPISHLSSLISHLSAPIPTRTARAYLKVQDGCSGQCTFCIVPKFRGKSTSVDFTELLDRSQRFIDAGYHELVVTGCNLSLYASQGKRLPELLDALAKLGAPANCRIRLGSLEPSACASETVDVIAANPNICRFLHLPIQSASNLILTSMKRPYLMRDLEALLTEIRTKLPHCGLGCDLMTGFPSETDADVSITEGFIRRHSFNNAHVFPYSERPGTVAAMMRGVIPPEIRSERAHRLSSVIARQRREFAAHFVGKTVEVLVEKNEKVCAGWTGEHLRCHFYGHAATKSLAKVIITGVNGDLLSGKYL